MANAFLSTDWRFYYRQSTGQIGIGVESHDDGGDFTCVCVFARGYSGVGADMDNPASEHLPGRGPIPRGVWAFGTAVQHRRLGPVAIPLLPYDGWEVPGGRSGFFIHGDNSAANKTASSGCIVLPRWCREFLSNSPCQILEVIE